MSPIYTSHGNPTNSNLTSRLDLVNVYALSGWTFDSHFLFNETVSIQDDVGDQIGGCLALKICKDGRARFQGEPFIPCFLFFVNPTAKRHFKSKTILLDYHLCCRHSQCLWNSKPTAQKAGMGVIFCPQLKQRQAEYQDKVVSGQTNLPNGIFLVFHQKNLYNWPWKWDRGASIQFGQSGIQRKSLVLYFRKDFSANPSQLLNLPPTYYITYLCKKL